MSDDVDIDPTPIRSDYADESDMLELIELFVVELRSRASDLERASHRGDLGTVVSLSHQLKGAAGGYGFPPITEQAATVERLARQGPEAPGQDLADSVDALVALCYRATAAPSKEAA